MLSGWLLLLISALYVGLLFGIAHWGDARAARGQTWRAQPVVYALALGVYCTSWTFYGAVGRGAASGWDFLPIYLGPMLVFVFAAGFIRRLVTLARRRNITSIADFIAARYGRHRGVAMTVTLIAVLGVLPYIALQLKAVAFSFEVLSAPGGDALVEDSALIVAALLAVFAILFGTRRVTANESHHGMVLAIAFESVIKLLAFLAVGAWAVWGLHEGFADAYARLAELPQVSGMPRQMDWQTGFWTQTLLAAIAILCLPRQFHVSVVENTSPREVATARWLFPLYLLLFTLFVLPVAAAGLRLLPGVPPDTFMLALPLAAGHEGLALAAYLGGFSAATSMVIVETIALATMVCNELVLPALLSAPRLKLAGRADLSRVVKVIRRLAILAIVAAAYAYYRWFTGPGSLTSIGLLSFAAVAQFAPALIGGLLWRGGSHHGAQAGLIGGFVAWVYCLLLPAVLPLAGDSGWLARGPLDMGWLRPQALFGIEGIEPFSHGALMSLAVNTALYVLVSLARPPGLNERLQAALFLDADAEAQRGSASGRLAATVGDVQALLVRFFGDAEATRVLTGEAAQPPAAQERIAPDLARRAEHALAGALGASSARLLLANTLRGREMQAEDVIRLLDETSHAIVFSQERLRATLEHLSQGVSVIDKDLRLVAWNRRYLQLFGYPDELIHLGQPIETLFRHNARRGLLGPGDIETLVARRMEHLQRGTPYVHERQLADGTVIEIRGTPTPGGGFVTSYSDVTAYTRASRALQEANDTLELRVADRTAALAIASGEAQRANEAKTRFLAAASHDLVQPLHAARLFLAAADREHLPAETGTVLERIGDSLAAAEQLLSGLLDISKLDAGALPIHRETFAADALLAPLAREFAALAAERGLRFRYRPTRALLHSDAALLRRVLQNFLGNALRYTRQGRVLLGVRREGRCVRIEVWDTGPGIPPEQQRAIFEEFRRLHAQDAAGERGLGLGLAISERIARLLDHALTLRSWPSRGSVFALTVPLGEASGLSAAAAPEIERGGERRARVLVIDNEPLALDALTALLQRWDHEVIAASSGREALERCQGQPPPDLALVDYHLDDGESGIDAATMLCARWQVEVPCAVITADPTREARDAAAAAGFALLQKPVKPAALRALMQRLLRDQAA